MTARTTPFHSDSRFSRGTGMSITLTDSLGNPMSIVAISDSESLTLDDICPLTPDLSLLADGNMCPDQPIAMDDLEVTADVPVTK